MLGLLLAACLAGAPFAAHAAGSWAYTASAHQAQVQRAQIHQVEATLLEAAPPGNPYGDPDVDARWLAPDGRVHTGQIPVRGGTAAGSAVKVWISQAGQLADRPLQHDQVVNRAQLAAGCAIGGLAVTLIVIGWLLHWSLNRRRVVGWEADWLTYGPRWTSRR